jgi:hypothetical protein
MLEAQLAMLRFPVENLPGLYALAFFWVKCVQHLAHSHLFWLVCTPPSGSLSCWHLLQNLKLMLLPPRHGINDENWFLCCHRGK